MGVSHSLLKQPYNSIAYRILLVLVWTQFTVLNFIKAIISRLPYVGSLSEIFVPVCIILAAMASLPWFLKHVKGRDMLFYWVYVLILLVTMGFFTQNREFLQEEWASILIAAVPFYFIGLSFSYKACSQDLFWCSAVGIVVVFLYRLYQINNGVILETDDMYTAYNVLPSVIYLTYYASCKNNKIYWGVAVVAAAFLFIFGTRGPVLCVVAYWAALIIKKITELKSYKKIFLIALVFVVVIFLIVREDLFNYALSVVAKMFGRLGFSTRIFEIFLSGDMVTSRGREALARATLQAIAENPVLGYGLTGDRHLFGIYPHNFILEIWCHFGVIVGTLILFVLFSLAILALWKSRKNINAFNFVLMLSVMVFGKLLMSSSYTVEPYFYFMIGLFISTIRKFSASGRSRYGE